MVHAPLGTTKGAIDRIVEKKKSWIKEKLRHPLKYDNEKRPVEFVSGESVYYMGREYRLEIRKGGNETIEIQGSFIVTSSSRERAREVFRNWCKSEARERFVPRVHEIAKRLGVLPSRVSITDSKYRWGSCTPKGTVTLNWRLVKAPPTVVDYVIVHELAHLKELNHSPDFWTIVKTHAPKQREAREWLKQHGSALEANF